MGWWILLSYVGSCFRAVGVGLNFGTGLLATLLLFSPSYRPAPCILREYHQYMEMHNERPNVGGVSNRNRNGAPSRKGCVVNGQMTKASNK